MGRGAGIALRGLQFFIRSVQFCCAAIVLALFSYFLATLNNHNLPIDVWVRAVEGISGVGVAYTALTILSLCCCAGRSFPSFLMMVLDVAFLGAFIYVASANRGGASTCTGDVDTPYGRGNAETNVGDKKGTGDGFTALPSLRTACKMETASLAVSIVAVLFFALSPFVSLWLVRHHKKEMRFGPSPANDYTSGYGHNDGTTKPEKRGGFLGFLGFGRKRTNATDTQNPNILPEHSTPDDLRDSYTTEQTHVDHNSSHGTGAGAGVGAGGGGGGGYGGLGNGTSKYETPYLGGAGDNIPMGNYSSYGDGHRYENNGGVYR
ncbi:uncharacterized protein C8A04DRAFT_9211 [Dichotomopilus funicola]|uniref:MARVEL domain-containing protein n=1 Tax=Dichotomopilus funicola TaxID=1934379 RepID=A0AAN6VA52_9PEZI|nr:hypothetical protein C8A04DRAFT_9211 [Dichotomopilus funicola]